MVDEPENIDDLLNLRRLTRSMSDVLRERMKGYVATLSPLLRPRRVFGDHVQGSTKDPVRNADLALKELSTLHDRLAGAPPFSLRVSLTTPIRMNSVTLEVTPVEYGYLATHGQDSRSLTVRSPLKWVLSYGGYTPARLRELLANRQRSAEELHDFLVHYLVLNIVMSQQTGVADILNALNFPVTTEHVEEFGDLPLTCIGCAVATRRPADDIIIRSVDLSGMDAFEEVVRLKDIDALRNPLKDELSLLLVSHGVTSQ